MSHKFASLLCGALLLLGGDARAEIYKWTDAEGVVHYSNSPPESRKAQTVSEDKLSVVPLEPASAETVRSMEGRIQQREKIEAEERAAARARAPAPPAAPADTARVTDEPGYYYHQDKKQQHPPRQRPSKPDPGAESRPQQMQIPPLEERP